MFLEAGCVKKQTYVFEEKQLDAAHFELEDNPHAPKAFISELRLESFSSFVQEIINEAIDQIPVGLVNFGSVIFSGRTWGTISHDVYEKLRSESEYAAWFYVLWIRSKSFHH